VDCSLRPGGLSLHVVLPQVLPTAEGCFWPKQTSNANCPKRSAHNPAMAIIVTSSRRRLVMCVLLALAVAGSVIRQQAPTPSALRDFGTLLMVMWLPAVGNLVAYLLRKIPPRKLPPVAFEADAPFSAQLLAHINTVPLPAGWIEKLDASERRCTAIVGRRGFTVRSEAPLSQWLRDAPPTLALECLVPSVALRELLPGTAFGLLVGSTVVARGVLEQGPQIQH
jgi:hypothetical protein